MKSIKHRRRVTRQLISTLTVILVGILISIGVIWNFIRVQDETGTANVLQLIVSLVAIISGVSGVVIGLSSLRSAQLDSIRDYFSSGDSKEYSYARSIIYRYGEHIENNGVNVYSKDFKMKHYDIQGNDVELTKLDVIKAVSFVSNFFHQWGLLAKNRYLPIWVFESASGVAVYRLFEYSREIIDEYRKTKNPFYAENFEWLYNKIKKTYRYEIEEYLNVLNKD